MWLGGCLVLCWTVVGGVASPPPSLHPPTSSSSPPPCGGVLTQPKGLITTPNFPGPFAVPLLCRWVLDASSRPSPTALVVRLTQLYVTAGLSFTEFAYYELDSALQFGGHLLHEVTESNVLQVQWLRTKNQFLVIEFHLDRLEGNHLRVLDDLLDVYGFNITYEMVDEDQADANINKSCSVVSCSLAGNCYANADFSEYSCWCLNGFSGPDCAKGPLCQHDTNMCNNGATCRHVGMSALCHCPPGLTGPTCHIPVLHQGCDGEDCSLQCHFDGKEENICNCDSPSAKLTDDRTRFELRLGIGNISILRMQHPGLTLHHYLERQIAKVLHSASLSKIEDLQVLNISNTGEAVFQLFGSEYDGSRLREVTNRLMERGKLAEVTLQHINYPEHSFKQEPSINLQDLRLNHKDNIVRQGDEFILSCMAQGSSYMKFNWFKDGIQINENNSMRNLWTRLVPPNAEGEYVHMLGVDDVSFLDEGRYTCQIVDWGVQQCRSLYVSVLQPPLLHVAPMSATLQKGDSINLKCVSPDEKGPGHFGYSWTRDGILFPMSPGREVWEDLKPGGTILRIYNIQKSATYTCQAHSSAAAQEKSIRLDVIDKKSVPICEASVSHGISWGDTVPASNALSDCPLRHSGVAKRACVMTSDGEAVWELPDFSGCLSMPMRQIIFNFASLSRGYEVTTVMGTISEMNTLLSSRNSLYPGEGEPIVSLLRQVFNFITSTKTWHHFLLTTDHVFNIVNYLLKFHYALIHQKSVSDLELLVKEWAVMWGFHGNISVKHMVYDSFFLDVVRLRESSHTSYYFPILNSNYPNWFNSKVAVHIMGKNSTSSQSVQLAVISYRNTSHFFPTTMTQIVDGSEIIYEIQSKIISIWAVGADKVLIELEFPMYAKMNKWNMTCAVTSSLEQSWDLTSCHTLSGNHNVTRCVCHRLGVFAAFQTRRGYADQDLLDNLINRSSVMIFGCGFCLTCAIMACTLTVIRWWRQKTCIIFLKIQFCTATATLMTLMISVSQFPVKKDFYLFIAVIVESLLYLCLSSQLGKLLLTYSDIMEFPKYNKHLKSAIIATAAGFTSLTVLCSLLAHKISGKKLSSWWLPVDSIIFYIFSVYSVLVVSVYGILFFDLRRKLYGLLKMQKEKKEYIIKRRIGLVHRSAVLLTSTVLMIIFSFLKGKIPREIYQYVFSILCALLGVLTFVCYIVFNESPLRLHPFKTVPEKKCKEITPSSDSDKNLFDNIEFFTKGDGEVESESAPTCLKSPTSPKVHFEEKEKPPKIKMVTFKGEPQQDQSHQQIMCNTNGKKVDLEEYPSSPKKYQHLPVDLIPINFSEGPCSGNPSPEPNEKTAYSPPTVITEPPPDPKKSSKLKADSEDSKNESFTVVRSDVVLDQISIDLEYLLNDEPQSTYPISPSKHMKTSL